jgi:hypothetical protein
MQEEVEQSVHPDGYFAKKERKHSHDGSTKKLSAMNLCARCYFIFDCFMQYARV